MLFKDRLFCMVCDSYNICQEPCDEWRRLEKVYEERLINPPKRKQYFQSKPRKFTKTQ